MSIEPYSVELDPETNTFLKIHLFKNVQNVDEIRNNIITGSWKCAVVKPSLIIDPFQVAVAANRAVVTDKFNSMTTRTVFAEMLFNLSLSKNISQSLSKFGIEKDKELLVCFLDKPGHEHDEDIITHIKGDRYHISELGSFTNLEHIKQAYKVNDTKCTRELLDLVVSKMVTKNIVSHQ